MKKLLAMALALVMALGVTTVAWADVEGPEGGEAAGLLDVVYVNTSTGDDTNGTGTADSPVKYLKKAMTLVKEGGIIRVTGQTTANPFWGNQSQDKTIASGNYSVTKSVTIEGYGDAGMHDMHGIALPSDFGGKLTLRNIDFDGNGAIGIYAGGIASTAEITIDNCRFNKAGGNCVHIAPQIASLTVKDCTFTAEETGGYAGQYLIWPFAAKNVTITGNQFDGKDRIRGAIHLGGGHSEGTTAVITGNTVKGFERGVQVAFNNGTQNTVNISSNVFENISHKEGSNKQEHEVAAVFLHENLAAEGVKTTVTVAADNTMTNAPRTIYAEDGVTVTEIVAAPAGAEVVDNGDGSYSVVEKTPGQPPRYYYNSTTTTKDTGKTSSPKTFDAGVDIYALTAVLSVTGVAYVGKKKF